MPSLPDAAAPHSHFTPARRIRFCDALSASGNIRDACARTGIAPQTAYRARRRCAVFARAWDAALVLARAHAEAVLADRALNGVEEAVFYHGEEVARRRRYDTRLLLAHLARLDARLTSDLATDRAAAAGAARFDLLLAELDRAGEAEPDGTDAAEGPPAGPPPGEAPPAPEDDPLEHPRAEHVAAARHRAEEAAFDADDGAWDEEEEDPYYRAGEEAAQAAGRDWDARRAALHARIDALAVGEEAEVAATAVPGADWAGEGAPETSAADPGDFSAQDCVTPVTLRRGPSLSSLSLSDPPGLVTNGRPGPIGLETAAPLAHCRGEVTPAIWSPLTGVASP